MQILYTAEATAWGGREGHTASSDGVLDLELAVPKELGGPGGAKTNPEQLFAAGYSSCFHSALKLVAARQKHDVSESAVTAKVGFGMTETGEFDIAVELEIEIPDLDRAIREELVALAHQYCPYSRATRGNIDVTLTIVD